MLAFEDKIVIKICGNAKHLHLILLLLLTDIIVMMFLYNGLGLSEVHISNCMPEHPFTR